MPKIQGDAIELHPAAVMFAIIIGGALADCSGRSLRCPSPRPSATSCATCSGDSRPEEPEALAASIAGRRAGDPGSPTARAHDERSDPYKILQVDPEAEDEVIAAAYRRLARKYHPDVATGPEAAARMAAINAAWERIGEPGAQGGVRSGARRTAGARAEPAAAASAAARSASARPAGSVPRPAPARDRLARLDQRPVVGRRRLRRNDARRPTGRRRGAAAGATLGQRPELRSIRRLVARRDRAHRHRVHRVARPRADRPARTATRSTGSCARAVDDAPPRPTPRTGAACTGDGSSRSLRRQVRKEVRPERQFRGSSDQAERSPEVGGPVSAADRPLNRVPGHRLGLLRIVVSPAARGWAAAVTSFRIIGTIRKQRSCGGAPPRDLPPLKPPTRAPPARRPGPRLDRRPVRIPP